MNPESRGFGARRAENAASVEEEVRLKIPPALMWLAPAQQEKFDDLMMSVIPWRGEGYTLGINGIFSFVPAGMVEEVAQYVQAPPSESQSEVREALLTKLRAIYDEQDFNQMTTERLRSFA